jgi:hypothetical protein
MHTNSPEVREIGLAAFPSYKGRSFQVRQFSGTMRLDSCWSEGSRDYYEFINLATKQTYSVPENGTPWSNGGKILECSELPMNVVLVRYHKGRCDDVTIFVREENMAKLLPAPGPELTRNEIIVLVATRSLKSSYAGMKNYRFKEANGLTKINLPEWEEAKASCIAKRLLNTAGAITDAGRNAVPFETYSDLHSDKLKPTTFYAIHKENKTVQLLNGQYATYAAAWADRENFRMSDGSRPTHFSQCGSVEDFEKRAARNSRTILATTAPAQMKLKVA